MRMRFGSFVLTGSVACLIAGATMLGATSCSSSDTTSNNSKFDGGTGGSTSGSNGISSGVFQQNDSAPPPVDAGPQPACVAQEAEAVPGKRPVDIIFAIDNSESMSEEIGEVENQINVNFATIIESSGTDYHLIMVSRHGAHAVGQAQQRICVKSPLSATTCVPIPAVPAETAKFIQHDSVVDSNNGLCQLLTTYSGPDLDTNHPQGWKAFLRPEAFKVITIITDDHPAASCFGLTFDDKQVDTGAATSMASAWDSYLVAHAPDQFGTAAHRNYLFNSIVGVANYDQVDTSKPYPPTAPLNVAQCTPSSQWPGLGYQALSVLTGGLRFPTCGLNYTSMFQSMARGVIDKATIACDYGIPADPPGGKIDPSTALVRYTSGTKQTDFSQVASLAACGSNNFYIDTSVTPNRIKLCADACSAVQADAAAKVKVIYSCFPKDVQ
jgi:hypothetical protein